MNIVLLPLLWCSEKKDGRRIRSGVAEARALKTIVWLVILIKYIAKLVLTYSPY